MKKIDSVQKLTENRHLNLYHLDARDRKGELFDYYFASRNPQEKLKLTTKSMEPEGGRDLCADGGRGTEACLD